MSRRAHHAGRRHGRPHRPVDRRSAAPSIPTTSVPAPGAPAAETPPGPIVAEVAPQLTADPPAPGLVLAAPEPPALPAIAERPPEAVEMPPTIAEPAPAAFVHSPSMPAAPAEVSGPTCTTPQLRRFIKSRAYIPMHELRRRFAIDGPEDDVTAVDTAAGRVFVGLPEREGRMLGELLRGGDIGYELSLDPVSPIVVGVYPMRPVPRT